MSQLLQSGGIANVASNITPMLRARTYGAVRAGELKMRAHTLLIFVALCGVLALPATAQKQDGVQDPASPYQLLLDCRAITDPLVRLSCYDEKVAKLETAKATGELVIADKEQVREARRGLFGFKMPSLSIFGGGDNTDKAALDRMDELETTIDRVSVFGYRQWRFILKDGAIWEQTDTEQLLFDPEVGDKIVIKRAAMGSFRAKIDGQRPIRVRRIE
jgi:hypothetical protein